MPEPMYKGERFGRVEVKEVLQDETWFRFDTHGFEIESSEAVYEFRCDCGKQWKEAVRDFKGKRAAKDCGCGIGYQVSASKLVTLLMPVDMLSKVKARAKQMHATDSQFMRDCILAGLEGRIKKS